MRGGDVAMIFQEPMTALNPVLRVREQMRDVIQRHQPRTNAEAEKLCLDLLAEMKIDDPGARSITLIRTSFPAACASAC